MIKTNSELSPRFRFAEVLNATLGENGYKFIKSSNCFKRKYYLGEQIISFSYINTFGLIHGIGISNRIIIRKLERQYSKLFGKHWTNWTYFYNKGYINEDLCEIEELESKEVLFWYSDESINKIADIFLKQYYPLIENEFNRCNSMEKVLLDYTSNPIDNLEFVPSNRKERRFLMALLLAHNKSESMYIGLKDKYLSIIESDPKIPKKEEIIRCIGILDSIKH